MIKIDFKNLFQANLTEKTHGLAQSDLKAQEKNFNLYKSRIESRNQGFLELPFQEEAIIEINSYASSAKNKYEEIVILGIGGSMLGPKCILDALHFSSKPKVTCVDNIDPYIIQKTALSLNFKKTLFLVQTKSGGTPETLAQYLFFKEKVEKAGLEVKNHFVFVTDPEKGYLRKKASESNVQTFSIAENVGGRFSVLTPVGLLAAALVGLDVKKILNGAKDTVNKEFFEENSPKQAYNFALVNYLLLKKGKSNLIIMPYNSRLKTFAEWCIQLISESTGKEFDLQGNTVNRGVTPIPAVGATDQHSQLQLFKEGPNDKLIVFLETLDFNVYPKIPSKEIRKEEALGYLENHSFNDLLQAEFQGTRQSLTESNRPNLTVTIPRLDEYSLGSLFMFFELHTAFLGEMLNIDTYNQPGVERSKVLTKEILQKN